MGGDISADMSIIPYFCHRYMGIKKGTRPVDAEFRKKYIHFYIGTYIRYIYTLCSTA